MVVVASSADVIVKFIADTAQMEQGTQSMGKTFKRLGQTIAGVFSTGAVIAFAKSSIDAAEEAARVNSKLETTYRHLGDTTGNLAKHAEDYATQLMKQTAIDDETIKTAQTKLLLFSSLSTAGAQTSGVFDRATAAAADLSARGLGDMSGAATKLGKLLQDPITNINALSRAGIQFTADQKAHLQGFIDAGDTLGAQNFILDQIEAKVGGSAAASATQADKAKVAFQEMQEQIGTALLPLINVLAPKMTELADGFAALPAPIQLATVALVAFGAIALTIGGTVGLIVAAVGAVIVVAVLLWTNWDQVWTWIVNHPALVLILSILAAPIAVFVLIIGALHFLYDNWSTIWGAIVDATNSAVSFITGLWNGLLNFFRQIGGIVAAAFAGIYDIVTSPFRQAIDEIEGLFRGLGDVFRGAVDAVRGVWNGFAHGWNGISIHIPSVSLPLVGDVGGGTVDLPNLPILGKGGIVTSATLALIGESGPEAVVPLGTGFGQTNVYNIAVTVPPTTSPVDVGAAVVDSIRNYERANGAAWRSTA